MDRVADGAVAAVGVARRRLKIAGVVQGVGFRPLVFRLAAQCGLNGYVCNELGEVTVEVEGEPGRVAGFQTLLMAHVAPPARLDRVDAFDVPVVGDVGFVIRPSAGAAAGRPAPVFPPDLAVCGACRADLVDPAQRFYRYPFTSCTYCGPRYAVIEGLPYDRPLTSMAGFPLCEACGAAYGDPLDRRFHAQTVACPACGPQVAVRRADGSAVAGDWQGVIHQAILAGAIVAVKGIGGFHLICDAGRAEVVQRLRERKRRPRRPLAVMARSLEVVERCFAVSTVEREALGGVRAPIVLLKPRGGGPAQGGGGLPLGALAPGHSRLGVMLPYSPLHDMLFPDQVSFLVATSGNASGLPIARTNDEALAQLGQIADLFLLHDREIVVRVEDSVCQAVDGVVVPLRRSRGYVPEGLAVPLPPGREAPVVLGAGAEQASTFCLVHQGRAILSQHIGDIDGAEHAACWHAGVTHVTGLLQAEPTVVGYDPHPGFLVSAEAAHRFGGAGATLIPVYHHHAHMAACMAEHGLAEPVIGCILDGTGFGRDGRIWGFEILTGDYLDFERQAHLEPIALPGGETAIKQPWIVAVSLHYGLDPDRTEAWARQRFPEHAEKLPFVLAQLDGRLLAPRASSAGRLFDGVAALLRLCSISTYEGEAAMLLGEQAEGDGLSYDDAYPAILESGVLRTAPLIDHLLQDIERSVPTSVIARRFHHTVAEMVVRGAVHARARTGLRTVVLGGGVWQNRYLLSDARRRLEQNGFQVYAPVQVPAGDGGLALGQAVSALWRWSRHVSGGAGQSD